MKIQVDAGEGKSSTRTPAAPKTPTPDAARPLDAAKALAGSQSGTGDRRSGEDRRKRIAEAAYYKSERRGFAPGAEEQDWLEAEKEIDGGKDG